MYHDGRPYRKQVWLELVNRMDNEIIMQIVADIALEEAQPSNINYRIFTEFRNVLSSSAKGKNNDYWNFIYNEINDIYETGNYGYVHFHARKKIDKLINK